MSKVEPSDDVSPPSGRRKSLVELDPDGTDGRRSSLAEFAEMQAAQPKGNTKLKYQLLIFGLTPFPPLCLMIAMLATDVGTWRPDAILGSAQAICLVGLFLALNITFLAARTDANANKEQIRESLPFYFCGFRDKWVELLDVLKERSDEANEALSFFLGPGLAITVPCIVHSILSQAAVRYHPEKQECEWSILGYCSTLSCTVANMSDKGYTFLFALFVLWAVIFSGSFPAVSMKYSNEPWMTCLSCQLKKETNVYPRYQLFIVKVLFQLGVCVVLFVGVSPSVYTGSPAASGSEAAANFMHVAGLGGGLLLVTTAVIIYVVQIVRLRSRLSTHCAICFPHALVMSGMLFAWVFLIGFFIQKEQQKAKGLEHDVYVNVCWKRDPGDECNMHTGFNFDAHKALYGIDPATELKNCTFSQATSRCFEKDCNYKSYTVSYALEVSGLYICSIALQGFVCLLKIDSQFLPTIREREDKVNNSL